MFILIDHINFKLHKSPLVQAINNKPKLTILINLLSLCLNASGHRCEINIINNKGISKIAISQLNLKPILNSINIATRTINVKNNINPMKAR